MEIYGYGEDALTLYALQHRMLDILSPLEDDPQPDMCLALYRPSFGRGAGSSFGEFDFVLFSKASKRLYLGESKWEGSSELKKNTISLRKEQQDRHTLFRRYIHSWCGFKRQSVDDLTQHEPIWDAFMNYITEESKTNPQLSERRKIKSDTKLSRNLHQILSTVWSVYKPNIPDVVDVLLFLHSGSNPPIDRVEPNNFKLITIDCSEHSQGNFVLVSAVQRLPKEPIV